MSTILRINYILQQVQHIHVSLVVSDEDLPPHRLCHLSHANMVRLASMVDGFAVPIIEQTAVFPACVAGKLTRRPFPRSDNPRAAQPLRLVHIDS